MSTLLSRALSHARLFVGVSQSQFLTGLSTFSNSFPQNGSKPVPKSQNRPLGYPHVGPFVVLLQHRSRVLLCEIQWSLHLTAAERGRNKMRGFIYCCLKNSASQGHDIAMTSVCVPSSLEKGTGPVLDYLAMSQLVWFTFAKFTAESVS